MTNTADANLQRLTQVVEAQFGLTLSARQIEQFGRYLHLLETTHHNLTAIKDPAEVAIKHFADSLSVLPALDLEPGKTYRLIDIGTGGGFPGVPLTILRPDQLHTSLLDSTTKKINFLRELASELELENMQFIDARTEEAGQASAYRAQFDRVTARAVAWMPVLAEYMLPLCKVGGICIAMKGETAQREVEEGRCAIKRLGGRVIDVIPVELPSIEEPHYLIKIAKLRPTPASYPRRIGVPKKEPILCPKSSD